jgi:hypothetical protein
LKIEGSAAVALVPVLAGLPAVLSSGASPEEDRDVVVVLTGRNVDDDRFEAALEAARPERGT